MTGRIRSGRVSTHRRLRFRKTHITWRLPLRRTDGSIKTEYARELSELLPLMNFWVMPSVFPGDGETVRRKCRFIAKVLKVMGLPVMDEEMCKRAERILGDIAPEGRE